MAKPHACAHGRVAHTIETQARVSARVDKIRLFPSLIPHPNLPYTYINILTHSQTNSKHLN